MQSQGTGGVSEKYVIASQCAHWRGNPVVFRDVSTEQGIATPYGLAMTW